MRHLRQAFARAALPLAVAAGLASPAAGANTPVEAANKQVVLDFYAALRRAEATGTLKQDISGIADKYLAADYVQHSETFKDPAAVGSDRDQLVRRMQSDPGRPSGAPPRPEQRATIMAEGDLVMLLLANDRPDPATGKVATVSVFNMFRVKDGKLAEHWDVMPGPAMPPPGAPPPAQR